MSVTVLLLIGGFLIVCILCWSLLGRKDDSDHMPQDSGSENGKTEAVPDNSDTVRYSCPHCDDHDCICHKNGDG